MKGKRLKALIIGAVALTAAGIMGTTLAMLQAKSNPAANSFAGAGVNIGVVENGKDSPLEDGNNTNRYETLVTGRPVDKTVQIKNISSENYTTTDTYVRVRLVPIFRDSNGGSVAADMSKVQYIYGNADGLWKKQEMSGEFYYYYTKALGPDEISSELVTAVQYNGTIPQDTTFELQVLTEGVAASQEGSLDAWGLTDFSRLINL